MTDAELFYEALQQAYVDLDKAYQENWILETRLMNARLAYRRISPTVTKRKKK